MNIISQNFHSERVQTFTDIVCVAVRLYSNWSMIDVFVRMQLRLGTQTELNTDWKYKTGHAEATISPLPKEISMQYLRKRLDHQTALKPL